MGETDRDGSGLRIPVYDVLRRPTVSRRQVLRRAAAAGGLVGIAGLGPFGAILAGCGDDQQQTAAGGDAGTRLGTLKVGVITPQSGIAAFLGGMVDRSLRATKAHIERESLIPGATVGYQVVNAPAEEGADAALRAYNQLVSDPDVIGIVWGTNAGLVEAAPQIQRDQMPVIACFADPLTRGIDLPAHPTLFQTMAPVQWLTDEMARFAARDRGYRTVGLLADTTMAPDSPTWMRNAVTEAGLEVVSEQTYSLFDADYGAQLQDLRRARPHCLFLFGMVDNAVGIVKQLDDLRSGYVDTPTAKSGDGWHPHLFANAAAIEETFGAKAGDAAKSGTISAWYLRGEAVGSEFQDNIRSWMVEESGIEPTGGEEGPADAFWVLLEAARRAGTTDRARVAQELPGMRTRFASLEFTLDPETHQAMTRDDMIIMAVDRIQPVDTDPPYVRAGQYGRTIDDDYVGPFALRRPTLEANRRVQPEWIDWALENGWGLQCTARPPDARGADVTLTDDCKIH
jgi:ABC-type branched-subunit amino acid transport system substrate-binding protein